MKYFYYLITIFILSSHTALAVMTPNVEFKNDNSKYLNINLGFTSTSSGSISDDQTVGSGLSGILSLGLDYEIIDGSQFSYGLYGRYHSTSDANETTNEDMEISGFLAGAFLRFHHIQRFWNAYIQPGFGVLNASLNSGSGNSQSTGLSLSPNMSLGVLIDTGSKWQLGIENMRSWGLGTKANGILFDDWTFKVRMPL